MRWGRVLVLSAVVAVLSAPLAHADHLEKTLGPSEPARDFPATFRPLLPVDSQAVSATSTWKDPHVGGWGGGPEPCPAGHAPRPPVVFVHGNAYDAGFWRATPTADGSTTNVRSWFLANGWCADELWAISYTGSTGYTTYNDVNVADVRDFLAAVRTWTGAAEVDVVGHSLGVTIVRKVLLDGSKRGVHRVGARRAGVRRAGIRRAVLIAGANRGTTSCRGSRTAHYSHVCDEVEPGSDWLAELNSFGDTLPGIDYLTLLDGTGVADNFYLGPDASSPRLDGACNHNLPFTLHLPLARGRQAVTAYGTWLGGGPLPSCARPVSVFPSVG